MMTIVVAMMIVVAKAKRIVVAMMIVVAKAKRIAVAMMIVVAKRIVVAMLVAMMNVVVKGFNSNSHRKLSMPCQLIS